MSTEDKDKDKRRRELRRSKNSKDSKFNSGQFEGEPVKGMVNNFKQLELKFDDMPDEEEAHDYFIGHDLNDIAVSIVKTTTFIGQGAEDILEDLMIEGVKAVKAWEKGDRKMPLSDYCRYRMKKRLPRLIGSVREDAQANMLSIHHRELFYQLSRDPSLTESEQIEFWIDRGYSEDEWHHLNKKMEYPDQKEIDGQSIDGWELLHVKSYQPHGVPEPSSLLPGLEAGENIWKQLFADGQAPLWTADLDEDDLLVLRELCMDPSASNREIGRILGHDHKWVKKRKDKLEEALKGWMQFKEVNDANVQ